MPALQAKGHPPLHLLSTTQRATLRRDIISTLHPMRAGGAWEAPSSACSTAKITVATSPSPASLDLNCYLSNRHHQHHSTHEGRTLGGSFKSMFNSKNHSGILPFTCFSRPKMLPIEQASSAPFNPWGQDPRRLNRMLVQQQKVQWQPPFDAEQGFPWTLLSKQKGILPFTCFPQPKVLPIKQHHPSHEGRLSPGPTNLLQTYQPSNLKTQISFTWKLSE